MDRGLEKSNLNTSGLRVFHHLIYEFKKGVRDMMLCTLNGDLEKIVVGKLSRSAISYKIEHLKNGNINVFFGKDECLVVANKICRDKPLNLLTPEEDFILGILLGYSISEQCQRYCKKHKYSNNNNLKLSLI